MRKAETMIAERLEKGRGGDIDLPLKNLVDISGDRMDRFGYGQTPDEPERQCRLRLATRKGLLPVPAKTIEATAIPSPRLAPPGDRLPQASEESPIEAQSIPQPQSPESQPRPLPLRGSPSADAIRRRAIA